MRREFYQYLNELFQKDPRVSILLGDIGVFSFKKAFEFDKSRIYNMGIMEQTMIGVSSGLSSAGFIPFVHSIAPFVTERCFEQLKLNLGYENKNVFIVSVGNSYDYAALGVTHHCPNDLKIISSIPNFKTFCPGNSAEVKKIIQENISLSCPKYIRLSEVENNLSEINETYDDLDLLSLNEGGLCVVVGTAIKDFKKLLSAKVKCSVVYTNKVSDFNVEKLVGTIKNNNIRKKITVLEPSYESGIVYKIATELKNIESINSICVRKEFIDRYGTRTDIDRFLGLDDESVINQLLKIYEN